LKMRREPRTAKNKRNNQGDPENDPVENDKCTN
jgi:hypothetical protein